MSFELRTLPLADLIPASYNPRKFTQPAYRKLKASLSRFGLVEPLVWNQRSGHVVGGHLRLKACRELGFDPVPVSVVDLDPAAEKALNIVLNNQEAQGRYDVTKLAEILGELQGLDQLPDTGFDASVLKCLILDAEPILDDVEVSNRVEVTLEMDVAKFEKLKASLDELIRDFDLVSHVKRG